MKTGGKWLYANVNGEKRLAVAGWRESARVENVRVLGLVRTIGDGALGLGVATQGLEYLLGTNEKLAPVEMRLAKPSPPTHQCVG